jgi:hypothetical protein
MCKLFVNGILIAFLLLTFLLLTIVYRLAPDAIVTLWLSSAATPNDNHNNSNNEHQQLHPQ